MITIGFSSHHIEVIPSARKQMAGHDVVVLEEPPSDRFREMLTGSLAIEDYLLELDSGFPEFDRTMCQLLRDLHRQGKDILQVEPYLERLLEIHELFAAGKTPEQVLAMGRLRNVYVAECRASGALIDFYGHSMSAGFGTVVEAVKRFARADAIRLGLRERFRARAIAGLADAGVDTYVEAGYIHYPLYHSLRKTLGDRSRIRVVFLLAPVFRSLRARRRNLGPGDILTLLYVFGRTPPEEYQDLLAARSLIYIKLIAKEEVLPGASLYPHAEDEARANRLVDSLTYDDCRTLFGKVRHAGRKRTLHQVHEYLGRQAVAVKEGLQDVPL
jgi:hypothetical protein